MRADGKAAAVVTGRWPLCGCPARTWPSDSRRTKTVVVVGSALAELGDLSCVGDELAHVCSEPWAIATRRYSRADLGLAAPGKPRPDVRRGALEAPRVSGLAAPGAGLDRGERAFGGGPTARRAPILGPTCALPPSRPRARLAQLVRRPCAARALARARPAHAIARARAVLARRFRPFAARCCARGLRGCAASRQD